MKDLVPIKGAADLSPASITADYASMQGQDDYGAPSSPLQLKRILGFLKRFWWLPIITLILSLGAGVAYVLWAPPTYVSNGRMWETEKMRLPDGATFTGDLQNYYGTQMELLQSDRLAELALARLKVSGTIKVPLDSEGKPLEVKVTARQAPKSTVFFLQVSSANAAYSQAFLDALMSEYLSYKRNVRKVVSGDTLNSISEQVQRLERELKDAQEAFTAFQRSNNLAIMQEEGTISGSYLARLKTQLSDLQLESRLIEATAFEQESAAGNTNSSGYLLDSVRSGNSGQNSQAAAERQAAFKELELLKAQREKLSKYLRPKHPKIAKLDSEIERGYKIAELYRHQNRDQLVSSRQGIAMRIESVQGSIKEWETKVVDSKSRIAEAERLKFTVTRSQGLYDRLALMLQNVDISRNIDQDTLAVLENASPAERSYKKELSTLGLAVFVGLAAGLGLVLLIAILDDRFTTLSEVTDKFGDSILGQVPEMRALRKEKRPALLHETNQPHVLAESYRNLRSALLFFPVETQRPKVLLITSAVPNEGKSTIAANLARTFAQGGSRVLLVDADLRKGTLHTVLGLQRGPGLAEVLERSITFEQALQVNCLPNLSFLSRGGHVTNPGDSFLSRDLGQALALWREQYDFVIIDTCPVFAADDAAALAPKADGTLLVVRRGFSRAGVTREALNLLLQRQAKVLGLVFNRADAASRSYYYYTHEEYAQGEAEDHGPLTTDHGQGTKGQGT